jgi:hypothetical protein
VVIIVIAASASGGGKKGPKTVKAALAGDIQLVDNNVQSMQIALGEAIQSATPANIVQLASAAQTAHTNLSNATNQILLDAPDNSAGNDLDNAINELKNAMGALNNYTGNPNASTLASFENQYTQATSDWDTAVGEIYAGTVSTPPSSLGS